jgi:hypothetical protein
VKELPGYSGSTRVTRTGPSARIVVCAAPKTPVVLTARKTTSRHTDADHSGTNAHLGDAKPSGAYSPRMVLRVTPVTLPSSSTMDMKS